MAKYKDRVLENVDGPYYVDKTCVNCGVSRHFAPDHFGDTGDFAFVKKQPTSWVQEQDVQRALLACPTASIGMQGKRSLIEAKNSLPLELAPDVFINGFNHRDSFGAHSYIVRSDAGNWLIDSPRFTIHLVDKFKEMGGIKYIFLTHRDDVSDAHLYAKEFGAKRIIHEWDAEAAPDAEMIVKGDDSVTLDSAELHLTPGHTRGHMVMVWAGKYLFSGDHYAWIMRDRRFGSFRSACWYSWEEQIASVEKMKTFSDIEWVFPDHGRWGPVAKGAFPEIIRQSVARMKEQAD
ncbi:MBL fold metallo-hydrolase [Terasakiella sp. A23]|uniref:MBL fold metallo-hydrolase n=1 Tax=Terasakiella sp. FCG-A23 TaxID=3080561 RepID=UPI0029547B2A|nr:MBL fold metallo-hydrolase [Terasakiella sp. A23]MDV7340471.1 MBL fold metallo-hydrolase [Terasakiella sp. A23]